MRIKFSTPSYQEKKRMGDVPIGNLFSTPSKREKKSMVEDRISNLPDDILFHVLSFLSTKTVARMSILSRSWKSKWISIPTLDFSSDFDKQYSDKSTEIIDKCLKKHKATNIKTFKIQLFLEQDCSHYADKWIRYVTDRQAQEMDLEFYMGGDTLFPLPSFLFYCQSLRILKLNHCILNPPPDFNGFRSLKTIHLFHVEVTDEAVRKLVWTCRLLEILEIMECLVLQRHLQFSAPEMKLKELVVYECGDLEEIEIDAPNLLSLAYEGKFLKLTIRNVPCLLQVKLSFFCSQQRLVDQELKWWRMLIPNMAHVKVLTMGECFKYVLKEQFANNQRTIFKNLKEFHWHDRWIKKDMLLTVVSFLRDCPIMEKICLDFPEKATSDREDSFILHELNKWREVNKDPSYLFAHLKTAKVMEFSGNRNKMQLVKFILEKAVTLESLLLILPQNHNINKRLLGMKLFFIVRASSHAQIIVLEHSEDDNCETHQPLSERFVY